MAGSHPFLTRLRAILRSLDDEALVGLANRGLLRRAQKDLESSTPSLIEIGDDRVRLQAGDAAVEVTELPAKSKCSCPASGICRHILMALVYLRDDAELAAGDAPQQTALLAAEDRPSSASPAGAESALQSAEPPSAAAVIGAATDEALQRWAGKALLRKAHKALAAQPRVEIDDGPTLTVRFPARNITCRWIPSGALLGMVCSCQAETVCEHVVTAVLAYQVHLGNRQLALEQTALKESSGAPRTRAEVLDSIGVVLREMVSLGLSRLSAATSQRLTSLAVSAHGVDLPRLERMLKTLANEIDLMLRRDAQASSSAVLLQAARIEALRAVLQRSATPAVVGRHRSQYFDVGQLTLVGVGARHWQSASGYHGLTVYFWDQSAQAWATWSDARPTQLAGFDPAGRFLIDGPWPGCASPHEAARSEVRLSGAWRNADGRLSGRASTMALVVGPARPQELPSAIDCWSDLVERVRKLFGGGLNDRSENDDLVLLKPRAWGTATYDPLRQELLRPILDRNGLCLDLWLRFRPELKQAVELLERHDLKDTWGLLGALRINNGRICVEPISLFSDEGVRHLSLLTAVRPATRSAAQRTSAAATEESSEVVNASAEPESPQLGSTTLLRRLLIAAQVELEQMAEGGMAARRNLDLLKNSAARFASVGLTACHHALTRVGESLSAHEGAQGGERSPEATALLRAYYVLRLAADQEAVSIACRGIGS